MKTIEDARAAKVELLRLLKADDRPDWLRGVGITKDSNGDIALLVNVNKITTKLLLSIPLSVYGIKVLVDEVGDFIMQK